MHFESLVGHLVLMPYLCLIYEFPLSNLGSRISLRDITDAYGLCTALLPAVGFALNPSLLSNYVLSMFHVPYFAALYIMTLPDISQPLDQISRTHTRVHTLLGIFSHPLRQSLADHGSIWVVITRIVVAVTVILVVIIIVKDMQNFQNANTWGIFGVSARTFEEVPHSAQ